MAQNEFLQHVEARNLLDTAEIPRFEERLCVYRSEEKRLDRIERDDSLRRYHRRERRRDGRSGCDQKCSRARDRGRRSCPGNSDDLNRSEVAVRYVGGGTECGTGSGQ